MVIEQVSESARFLICLVCEGRNEERSSYRHTCCSVVVCRWCLTRHFIDKLNDQLTVIPCISCDSYYSEKDLLVILHPEVYFLYFKNILNPPSNKFTKTCPGCNQVEQLDYMKYKQMKMDYKKNPDACMITCSGCDLNWCFFCWCPWHSIEKDGKFFNQCKWYRRLVVDELERNTDLIAHQKINGTRVARKCRCCNIYIEQNGGCPIISCWKCGSKMCYKCGRIPKEVKYFGGHHSKYSVFGCDAIYKPYKPIQRNVIRGALFIGKCFSIPITVPSEFIYTKAKKLYQQT